MAKEDLSNQTMQFAIRTTRLVRALPPRVDGEVFGKQLLRCATSVAANYRAACRGKSRADFLAKMKICDEEADETIFWLELIANTAVIPADKLTAITAEARELSAIITSICKTTAKTT